MNWKRAAFLLYPLLIVGFGLALIYFGRLDGEAVAGTIRRAELSTDRPLLVHLAMGRGTAISFSVRPEKVVAGNPQGVEINFVGRDLPSIWTHGKHTVTHDELALSQADADMAASYLQRCATYMLAIQIKESLAANFDKPRNCENASVRSAFQIARLIRNAFAHNPFNPTWLIDKGCEGAVYEIPEIIRLETSSLNEKRFDWRHYGGLLALLRLSQFVRRVLLSDDESPLSNPNPTSRYQIQQGSLILTRISEIPDDGAS